MLELRPEVVAFAQAMEERLRANDHKGGWKTSSMPLARCQALFELLDDEVGELFEAIQLAKEVSIRKEAADVANFAMMIADVCGALPQSAP